VRPRDLVKLYTIWKPRERWSQRGRRESLGFGDPKGSGIQWPATGSNIETPIGSILNITFMNPKYTNQNHSMIRFLACLKGELLLKEGFALGGASTAD